MQIHPDPDEHWTPPSWEAPAADDAPMPCPAHSRAEALLNLSSALLLVALMLYHEETSDADPA